jgi:hypothetical protein
MLWATVAILCILWLIGLIAAIGGGLIHLLLVVAAIVFIVQLLSGRRTVQARGRWSPSWSPWGPPRLATW